MLEEIKQILPPLMAIELNQVGTTKNIVEVRIRVAKKTILNLGNSEIILSYVPTLKDMLDILVRISSSSIYAIQKDINQGFVTIKGGHRIGLVGEVVMEEGKIVNIKNINGMNIRVARQILGSADQVIPHIISSSNVKNTLIISPPCCGKTTILRDMIRKISNGESGPIVNVGVVDERGEIASVYNGIPYLDVGLRTDVLSNVPKHVGIRMMIRSMGIGVVATDEVGSKEDMEAIKEAALSGVKLLFTMHGNSLEDVYKKYDMKQVIDLFDVVIILSNKNGMGTIEKVHLLHHSNLEVV